MFPSSLDDILPTGPSHKVVHPLLSQRGKCTGLKLWLLTNACPNNKVLLLYATKGIVNVQGINSPGGTWLGRGDRPGGKMMVANAQGIKAGVYGHGIQ